MSNEIIIAILSSSLLTALFTALINGWFEISMKNKDYQNMFYKDIIDKRLEAYKFIDTQICVLKNSAYDGEDNKTYHLIFAYGEDDYYNFQKNLHIALSKSLWLSAETKKFLSELNLLFLKMSLKYNLKVDLIDCGKEYYEEIVKVRDLLEKSFCKDISEMHNVKKFLKNKNIEVNGIHNVELPIKKA